MRADPAMPSEYATLDNVDAEHIATRQIDLNIYIPYSVDSDLTKNIFQSAALV
jgi:hypothetical protein